MRFLSALLASAAVVIALVSAPVAQSADAQGVGFSPGYGIFGDSDAALAADLDAAKAAGATWARFDVDWSAIQGNGPRSFDWSATDRVVNAATARGLKVDGLVTYAPGWAAPGGGAHPVPNPATFATFAGQAATHYAGRVSAWEVWNEPDLQNFWGTGANPAAYTALLKAAYPKIKAAAPGVPVLSAGLAPATTGGGDVDPRTFVTGMYAAGAAGSFDALALHPYSYPALPSDTSTASWNLAQQAKTIHQTMAANGDGAKQIWMTEFGAPTGGGVSEQQQANIIRDGLNYFSGLGFSGPVFVYSIRDTATGSSDPESNFGVLRTDRSHKPSFGAVLGFAGPVVTPTTTASPTVTPTTTPVATHSPPLCAARYPWRQWVWPLYRWFGWCS